MKWWRLRQQQRQAGHVALTYHDPMIAGIVDPAARAVADAQQGRVAQLENTVAMLENQCRHLMGLVPWMMLKKGNPQDAANAEARAMLRASAGKDNDAGSPY